MVRNFKFYLDDITESISIIHKYLEGKTEEQLFADQFLQDALFRRLEIIGEASRQLPDWIKQQHPEVPWKDIINMRNVFVHEYFGIDLDLVWRQLHQDLTQLKQQIDDIVNSL